MTETPQDYAYRHCVQLLARREYSQLELRRQLNRQHIAADVVDGCLARLLADNYQSDHRFAEMLCRTRIAQRHGSEKIRYELKQKGIDDTLINAVLADYDQTWVENAKHLIERKAPQGEVEEVLGNLAIKAKISRFLLGKGYAYDTINQAFAALQSDYGEVNK